MGRPQQGAGALSEVLVRHARDAAAAGVSGTWAIRCSCALSRKLESARLGVGELTTESTEHTEKREELMEQDPFTRRVIGCAIEVHRVLRSGLLINFNVRRLADGIDRFKL